MARLIDRNGWERTDDSIDPAAERVSVRSAVMSTVWRADPDAPIPRNSVVQETIFYRRSWRHADGSREEIFFEDPERADAVMHGRSMQTRERLLLEARRAREACVLALRLVEEGGELLLGPEIEAGEITDHDAARVVAEVIARLRIEASWVTSDQAERLLRAAGIPRPV